MIAFVLEPEYAFLRVLIPTAVSSQPVSLQCPFALLDQNMIPKGREETLKAPGKGERVHYSNDALPTCFRYICLKQSSEYNQRIKR